MATWNAFVSKVRARVVKVVTGALRAAALPAADLAGAVARTRSRMRARVLLRLYKVAKQTLSRARTGHPRPFHRPGTAAGPPPGTGQPLAVVDNVVLASAATLPQTTRLLSGTSGSLPRAVAAMQKVDQTRVMTMIRVAVGRVPGRIVELCPAGPAPLLVAMTRRAEQPEKRPPGGNGRTVAPAGHQFWYGATVDIVHGVQQLWWTRVSVPLGRPTVPRIEQGRSRASSRQTLPGRRRRAHQPDLWRRTASQAVHSSC
ncbi:Uncharacterized protein PBTT_05689 [Plasmodiophora brassicae]